MTFIIPPTSTSGAQGPQGDAGPAGATGAAGAAGATGATGAAAYGVPGGRLTLTSGDPNPTGDVTGAGTLYYTPYNGDRIALWDGAAWAMTQFTEKSVSLAGISAGVLYDVWGSLSAGALVLSLSTWTNTATRADAISLQDGVYCKTGDKTKRLLGTICGSGSGACTDSYAKRYVSNVANVEIKTLFVPVAAVGSHTYSTASWRRWNNESATVGSFIQTLPRFVRMSLNSLFANGGDAGIGATFGTAVEINGGPTWMAQIGWSGSGEMGVNGAGGGYVVAPGYYEHSISEMGGTDGVFTTASLITQLWL